MIEKFSMAKRRVGKSEMCSGDKFYVTLKRKDNHKTFGFTYHDNYLNKSDLKTMLECVLSDIGAYAQFAYTSVNEAIMGFKNEFGYESFSDARRVYFACQRLYVRMHNFLSGKEYDELCDEVFYM